jgi:hypothetical protein
LPIGVCLRLTSYFCGVTEILAAQAPEGDYELCSFSSRSSLK